MSSATAVGREPVTIVELDQDRCSRVFGVAPCTGTGVACYNTYATCKSLSSYALGTPLTLRFCQNTLGQSYDSYYLIPLLDEVEVTPTRLNPAGADADASAFGERASIDISLNDAPHTDNLVDPYLVTRTYDPLSRSTFWRKWLQRNPYHNGRAVRVRQGYLGQSWSTMLLRHYLIDSIELDGSQVRIVGKDPLTLTDEDTSVAPKPTGAGLYGNMTETQTSCIIFGALAAAIPASGWVRIGAEIIRYASKTAISAEGRITLQTLTRGTYGSKAEAHQDKDTVQVCLNYQSQMPWRVARDLLLNYAAVPSSYITLPEWDAEGNDWLAQFTVSCIISEPTGIGKLIAEICQQVLMYIWYDDVARQIRMRAIRPYDGVSIPLLTDADHLIADSTRIRVDSAARATQVWLHHRQRNAAESAVEAKNYDAHYVRIDTAAESAFAFSGVQIVHIYARWLESDAQVRSVASRYLARYRNAMVKLQASVDAKDRLLTQTGAVLDVQTSHIVDATGLSRSQRFEVVSAGEATLGETILLELQTAAYDANAVEKNAYIMTATSPDYASATTAQKAKGCWIANSAGKLPGGDDGYHII